MNPHRREQWVDDNWQVHTATWWDSSKYAPWMPWYTSLHMMWIVPVLMLVIGVGVAWGLL